MASNKFYNQELSLDDLKYMNVVGTSGAGKSTLAGRLGEVLNQPHIEMDGLYWKANWTESETDEFRQRLDKVLEKSDGWILDGNYNSLIKDLKKSIVRTIVWVDYSFPRTFCHAVTRALKRVTSRREIWPGTGNRESFRRTFLSHDSVLLWTLISFSSNRKRYRAQSKDPAWEHVKFIRLASPRKARQFVEFAQSLYLDSQSKNDA